MIKVDNVWKTFKLYKKPSDRLKEIIFRKKYHTSYQALKGVSFNVKEGEVLGIIGPNGAGKSTLLKILTGVLLPDKGKVEIDGKITGLLELGTGFNFELTGFENIYINGLLIGMSKEEIDKKVKNIIDFSELGEFIYEPIKTYSSGMVMRLAFSIAIHADPKCFIVDEALAVGDAHFQQKCVKKLKEFKNSGGSIIFVSHDMNMVKVLCDRAILLNKGEIIDEGLPEKVVNSYNFLLAKINDLEDKIVIENKESSYGTQEVIIENVSIKGQESGGDIISSGEKALIEIMIKSNINIENATVGILIRDRFGQDIFGTNTEILNKKISLEEGETYKVVFELPLNIAPGKYTLTVAVHDGKIHSDRCYHWIDNVLSFQVAGFKYKEFVGVAYLPTEVEVEKIGELAHANL